MESTSTFTSEEAWRTAGIPSMPDLPGITRSITTTSGLFEIVSKTARSADSASPTTSMSASASSTRRRPERRIA